MIGEKVMKGYVESVLEGELDEIGYPKIEASEPSASESQGNDNAPAPSDSGYRPTRRRY